MKQLRLALNAWSLVSTHAGIASYTGNLALALQRSGEVELNLFYGFGWSSQVREGAVPGIDSFKGWVKRLVPRPYALMRLVQQQCFSAGVTKFACDVYHEPSFLPFRFAGPTVITVHDLSPLHYPQTHPPARVREVLERLPRAVREAHAVIVDSEFVRQDVIRTYQVSPERITSIPLGVGSEFHPRTESETASVLAARGLVHRGYILAVGTLEPRKNLVLALDAHSALPDAIKRRLPLIVAGSKGWLTNELDAKLHAAERRGEVRWLGYVPAHELPVLYSGARLFVYPSIYEGFGLPVLEAMASGTPVITTGEASLPEVSGEAAIVVAPRDVGAHREAIVRVVESSVEAARLAELGLVQARRFTWQACAERTLGVYRQVLREAGRR
jgi:glycosyltransferase involved in cell wall biosynthesis